MSGRRIDDHSFWAGKGGKDSVFPKGVHTKHEKDDGHDGHLMKYEDTSEAIEKQQEIAAKKAKGHAQKEHYRN